MRTTLDIDTALVKRALRETGARSMTALVEMALRALVEQEPSKHLKGLFGTGPRIQPVRRRRG